MKKHPVLSSSTNWDDVECEAEWHDTTLKKDRRSFGDEDFYSVEQLPYNNGNSEQEAAAGCFDSLRSGAKFVCSGEAWRTPNIMHIFIAFFLYMLANAFVTTASTLVCPLSASSHCSQHLYTRSPTPQCLQIVIDLCDGDTSEAASLQSYLSAASAGATLVTAALLGVVADRWGRVSCLLISLVRIFHPPA
jgi:hypothetical protein